MKKESYQKRKIRKQKEFKMAIYRTVCNIITVIFAVLSFIISIAIFMRVYS